MGDRLDRNHPQQRLKKSENPKSTPGASSYLRIISFPMRVDGDSLNAAGIHDNDLMVVQR